MAEISHDHAAIRRHLGAAKTIAVVGMSDNPAKASRGVAGYLKRAGYRIIPVNPTLTHPIFGEQPYARLTDIPAEIHIDIIDVFRRSVDIPAVAEAALQRPAPLFWMQLGISNPDAAKTLIDAGFDVIQDRCIKIDHAALGPFGAE